MSPTAAVADRSSALAQLAVLIPARRQPQSLIALIDELVDAGFGAILVVDDGSPAEDKPILNEIAARPRVHLLRHAVNLGKGRALKTGINHFLSEFPNFLGLITADADGQHTPVDIVRVAHALLAQPSRFILGARGFSGAVPFRSRFGNSLTSLLFHFTSGQQVRDTQTGLRAFPTALLPELLTLAGERYEYEMTVLAHLCRQGHIPVEIPIATIYLDGNRSSHFNPVRDSMRIYFVLLRFYTSALIASAIDFVGFTVTFALTHNVAASIVAGRLSSLANFALNREFVFHSRGRVGIALGRYSLLVAAVALVSYGSIQSLTSFLGWNVFATKAAVETLLSLATFSIQRIFIFPASTER
jgi:glycosyltransferase involved in cell wall biosynthesis